MLQCKAMNGEALMSPINVNQVGNLNLNPLPAGLVGIDIEKGLVEVIPSPNKQPIFMKYGRLLKNLGKTDAETQSESTKLTILKVTCQKELKFTTSSEEVIDVYERGPQSCMKGCDSVGAYATDDVAVAYIEDDNKVIARAVVCINEEMGKHYVCTYGFGEPLEYLLKKAGFIKGDLEGCTILKLEDSVGIRAPYLDGCTGVNDEGDYLRIQKYGEFDATSTSGYLNMRECQCCGAHIHEDEGYYSEHLEQTLCESCYGKSHVHVDGEYYHIDSGSIQELENGDYVLSDDAVYVDYRSEYHHRDDCCYNFYLEEYMLNEDLQ